MWTSVLINNKSAFRSPQSAMAWAAALFVAAQQVVAAQPVRPATNPLEGQADAIQNGGAMFRTRCAGCHGPDARGYLGPDLTSLWASGSADDRIFDILRSGG